MSWRGPATAQGQTASDHREVVLVDCQIGLRFFDESTDSRLHLRRRYATPDLGNDMGGELFCTRSRCRSGGTHFKSRSRIPKMRSKAPGVDIVQAV